MPSPRLVPAAIVAVGAFVSASTLFGFPQQTAPKPATTFVDKIDLVTAEMRVVDKDGKAVPSLPQTDLVTLLDGRPAEAVSLRRPETPQAARAILLVVDDLSAQAQQLKGLTDSAEHFLGTLQAADLVGVATTSGLGPSVAPTRDRAAVVAAFHSSELMGRADARTLKPFVSVSEAFDMVRTGGNKDTGAKVVQRECSAGGGSGSGGGGGSRAPKSGGGGGSADDSCATRIVVAARAEALLGEETTGQQIAAYARLLGSLRAVPGPRSLIVLTGGLALPLGVSDALTVVGRAAAENDVALYGLVAIDDGDLSTEASSDRLKARRDEDTFLTTGVESLAAATGGEALRPAPGDADRFYARILAATDSEYHLGFVMKPSETPARYFPFKVSSKQPGLVVHATAEAVHGSVEMPVVPTADALKQRIEQGGTRFAVPLALTTSRRRDTSPTRVQVAMDIEVPASTVAPVVAMFALIDGTGKVVQSGQKDLAQTPGDTYRLAFGLPVEAGDYRLRLAVADGHGSVGSLDDVLSVRLPKVGTLATSDLVTASARADGAPHLLARELLPAGAQTLHVSLELYPEPQDAASVKVQLSVGLASGGPAIVGGEVPGVVRDGRLLVSAALPVAALKPDRYVVTATILTSGKPAGTVTAYVRKVE